MLLKYLRFLLTSTPPILWCNNNGALALASNPIFHACTNHVEIDYDFLREKVVNNDLLTQDIGMTDHVA
jgi:hypothetical protein